MICEVKFEDVSRGFGMKIWIEVAEVDKFVRIARLVVGEHG